MNLNFSFQNPKMKNSFSKTLFNIFSSTEIFHASLTYPSSSFTYSVLFKLTNIENSFHFLLYTYSHLYYSKQTSSQILSLNKTYNPSIEFSNLDSLISFLIENLIRKNQSLLITSQSNLKDTSQTFMFESLVDIITVKYSFEANLIEDDDNFISQQLFVKPLNNILLGLGQLINNENDIISNRPNGKNVITSGISVKDCFILVDNVFVNKKRGFSNGMTIVTKESSIKVNNEVTENKQNGDQKEIINNVNTKERKIPKQRKFEKTKFIGDEIEDVDKKDDNDDNDENKLKQKTIKENKIELSQNLKKDIKKSKKKKMNFI